MTQVQEDQQLKRGGIKEWLVLIGKILEVIITLVMFFLGPLVELLILGTYVVYDWSYFGLPVWLTGAYKFFVLHGYDPYTGTVTFSLFFIVFSLLGTLSRLGWKASRTPFFSPSVFTWLVGIGLAYAVIGHLGLVSIIAQWLTLLWFSTLCIRSKSKPSMVVRRAMEAPLPKNQVCSICQQPSVSDPCLSCEGKYRSEVQRVRTQTLRARLAGAPATLTLKEWLNTLDNFHWHCAYCHGSFEVMEHYIPLPDPKGGTTAENCVPACHKCNLKKSNKHPDNVGKDK